MSVYTVYVAFYCAFFKLWIGRLAAIRWSSQNWPMVAAATAGKIHICKSLIYDLNPPSTNNPLMEWHEFNLVAKRKWHSDIDVERDGGGRGSQSESEQATKRTHSAHIHTQHKR